MVCVSALVQSGEAVGGFLLAALFTLASIFLRALSAFLRSFFTFPGFVWEGIWSSAACALSMSGWRVARSAPPPSTHAASPPMSPSWHATAAGPVTGTFEQVGAAHVSIVHVFP